MKIANSITNTRNIGIDIDVNTKSIIKNTANIDITFTRLKSLSAILTKFFVKTPSPVTILSLS